MTLRIFVKSPDGTKGYAEEVRDVRKIDRSPYSLLENPCEYTDRNGRIRDCEFSEIYTDFTGMTLTPVICAGVYRVDFA